MVVLPLVVSSLALAVVEIGDVRRLGKARAAKTLLITAILSSSAVALGITLVDTIRPGAKSLPAEKPGFTRQAVRHSGCRERRECTRKPSRSAIWSSTCSPKNPLQEMVGAIDGTSKGNGMLAVMVFSLLLGAANDGGPRQVRRLSSAGSKG